MLLKYLYTILESYDLYDDFIEFIEIKKDTIN